MVVSLFHSLRRPVFILGVCTSLVLTACRHAPAPPKQQLQQAIHHAPEVPAVQPPAATMSMRAYLKQQLGPRFHGREEWAGTGTEYAPQPYPPRVWSAIGNPYAVTIHHAEIEPTRDSASLIRSIFRDHTHPGGRLDAADVGYHFFVDIHGEVWEGRDATHTGTHVGSRPPGLNNPGNLGICGLGSYVWEEPPQTMVQQTVNLTMLIAQYYGHAMVVRGHRDWGGVNGEPHGATECPGKMERAVILAHERMVATYPQGAAPGAPARALGAITAPAVMNAPLTRAPQSGLEP